MIEIKNITCKLNENVVLDGVSFKVNKGESIAIIGPNGSGKTTLLRVLNGLIDVKRGEYIFDGQRIDSRFLNDAKKRKIFHKRIGFVFQNSDNQLFCKTVFDEIAFGLLQFDIKYEEIEKRVYDCLKLLDIEHLKNRVPYTLSGGEKKKVAIASILALNPDVLILDEPLNEIDPKSKRKIKELLQTLNGFGKTIICATHDFDYFKGLFKRAIVLSSEHKIIYDGDFDSLIGDKEFLEDNNII
ncbi:energy-coupling factor ABC transporter ATP-binding protein [Caloramator proteoclasticus]|uniref:Cobalt/nickel transport system ATP-binding protein n=1 Tax=Caloramator proteoclasticus DSM 10124 TaxID=1121262 RepID=A0A1M4Y3N5_9CLOT|nr:ABC transporter ATP-binding protein [Caloramator proteoclasticus]SHF00361.1 cobalt/nickel transport system ATP-binding protein [Caloramator proteoclasticus DSM 10124]